MPKLIEKHLQNYNKKNEYLKQSSSYFVNLTIVLIFRFMTNHLFFNLEKLLLFVFQFESYITQFHVE